MFLFQALIVLVAAALTRAQLPDIPACSINCFVSALSTDGCSSLTDFACHCEKPQLIRDITPCVEQTCDSSDKASVSRIVVSQCSEVGHPISLPPSSTSASAGSSISTAVASPPATGTTGFATATDSIMSSESSSFTSARASGPVWGSVAATPAQSAHPSSSPAGFQSGFGSVTARTSIPLVSTSDWASGSATPSAFTGGAANVKGNMAGVAAIAAAAYIL